MKFTTLFLCFFFLTAFREHSLEQVGSDFYGENPGDLSGRSVAFSTSGKILAFGAPKNDTVTTNSGQVKVFKLSDCGEEWTQLGETLLGETYNEYFGFRVALSKNGKTLAVGSFTYSGASKNPGKVQVYKFKRGKWHPLGSPLQGKSVKEMVGLSLSLSKDGQTLAVGSPGSVNGHVTLYRYNKDCDDWIKLGQMIEGGSERSGFGYSVSLGRNGKALAVGAWGDDTQALNAGLAKVFFYNPTTDLWEQRGQGLLGERESDYFGTSLSLSEDGMTLAVGAKFHERVSNKKDAGQVKVFRFQEDKWELHGQSLYGKEAHDQFGHQVSLSRKGKTLAVGSPYSDENGSASGAVRMYSFDKQESKWQPFGEPLLGDREQDKLGFHLALSSNGKRIAVGAYHNDGPNGNNNGQVKVFKKR